jgi:hypothetical protein
MSENAKVCDFHEPYFGASYPDACCIDGMLWDLDSCHAPGGPLHSGGDVPCPQCNHDEWLKTFEDEIFSEGYAAFKEGKSKLRCHKAVRHEQPQDATNMQQWFEAGWNEAAKETAEQLGVR